MTAVPVITYSVPLVTNYAVFKEFMLYIINSVKARLAAWQ